MSPEGRGRLRLGDAAYEVAIRRDGKGWRVEVDGEPFAIGQSEVAIDVVRSLAQVEGASVPFCVEEWTVAGQQEGGASSGRSQVRSPMSGKLVEVRVVAGAAVAKGDVLFVLEAMKMQNEVRSPTAGRVASVQARAGDSLGTTRVVVEIDAA